MFAHGQWWFQPSIYYGSQGEQIRSRLLSTREAARLMGLPDSYELPKKYSEAYHLLGDGLVVPVVSWLEEHLLHPLAASFAQDCTDEFSAPLQPTIIPAQQPLEFVI